MGRVENLKQPMPAAAADIPKNQHKKDTQNRPKKSKRRMSLQLHEDMFRFFFN